MTNWARVNGIKALKTLIRPCYTCGLRFRIYSQLVSDHLDVELSQLGLLIGGGRLVDAMWVKLLVSRAFDRFPEVVDG